MCMRAVVWRGREVRRVCVQAGDVAAGLLLLFAHGLGQALEAGLAPPPGPTTTAERPLVIMLGFAGGTPADLGKCDPPRLRAPCYSPLERSSS